MVDSFVLPRFRQDLGITPAPVSSDGSPTWNLHDPAANRFYQLSWPAFEILSRWNLGTADAVLEAVNRETTLMITDEDIRRIVLFLEQNFLLEVPPGGSRLMSAKLEARKMSMPSWLLKNYLFFRIPLIYPQRFLDIVSRKLFWIYTPYFWVGIIFTALIAMFLVSRQWEVFWFSFTTYQSWEGIITLGAAVFLAKIAHEFGHALTAHRYGCRVPAMGIALVVMFPMFYTDTNEVWKLTSRKQRLAVGIAGMTTELLLALAAILVWVILPEGPLKAATFILATSSWVITLAINASPFLRFDGYFILCDLLGIANLHSRSFAFGQWWLRKILFGFDDHPPEPVTSVRRIFLITFSYMTWLYRFAIFLGIAVIVYKFFFKALGLVLFSVEIWWFILLPIYQELRTWSHLRKQFRLNVALVRTLLILLFFFLLLIIPWNVRLTAPAVLSAAHEQQVFSPAPSIVLDEPVSGKQGVHTGDALIHLISPELQYKIDRLLISESVSRWQVEQQPFDERMLNQGMVPKRRLEASGTELVGIINEKDRLTVRALIDGIVLSRNDEIQPGLFLPFKEPLYVVVDTRENRVDAFVDASDLKRIHIGNHARFIPDALEFGVFDCRVADIDSVNLPFLEEPSLASTYGGPVATRVDQQGRLYPSSTLFRIRLNECSPKHVPALRLRGTVGIDAEKRSLLIDALRHVYNTLIRESGF